MQVEERQRFVIRGPRPVIRNPAFQLAAAMVLGAMIFLVRVYHTRGSENLDSHSTFSEGEIVARQPCEADMLILAF